MSQFIVDVECINEAIENLKSLRETLEEHKSKQLPERGKNKGKTYEQLRKEAETVLESWGALINLVDKTLLFLGDAGATYQTADQQSASAIEGSK